MIRPPGLALTVLAAALALPGTASALETKVTGRLSFGAAFRTEAPDPAMLVSYNAAAIGLVGMASAGQNTDDANLNFRRGDATTRALRGYLDVGAKEGAFSALLRVKAWHDFALSDHARTWGNNPGNYAAGQPLSDAGGARLSRFSGVAMADAWVQHSMAFGSAKLLGRLGQQSLAWGERAGFAGGLAAINAVDAPAVRRAGAVPPELRVPAPMLFARLDLSPAVGLEGFYQFSFRPSAQDMCGTFWASTDYLTQGCDRAFAGPPAVSDRQRLASGSFVKRSANPTDNDVAQYGAALTFKSAMLASEFGIYAARYTNRGLLPGLRKSSRVGGAALIPGDPGGLNLSYFTEYPNDLKMLALTATHKRGKGMLFGELAYRAGQPVQLPPGDVLPAFLSPVAPSLLRADANAVAPGGVFHAYDRLNTVQLQVGLQNDWGKAGPFALSSVVEAIGKHAMSLPDPALRRYGRPDQFGGGPVNGVCTVTTTNAARQCSLDGYVSPSAYAWRLRLDARVIDVLPALNATVTAMLVHDVKGWSHDFLINEGRKTANLALRLEYRQRYLAEVVYAPVWGGVYNHQADRDLVSLAAGIRF